MGAAHEVTCDMTGVGTNSSVMTIMAKSLEYGSFSCFCEDALGANSTSVTLVVEQDKTTSAEAWEVDVSVAESTSTSTTRTRPSNPPVSGQEGPSRTATTMTTTTTSSPRLRAFSLAMIHAPVSWQLLSWCLILAAVSS